MGQENITSQGCGALVTSCLRVLLHPTETASRYLVVSHWTVDWDSATIIKALEELYRLQAEHNHLDFGSRWQQVIDNSVCRVLIQSDNMEKVCRRVEVRRP
jgi:hypothetical protein